MSHDFIQNAVNALYQSNELMALKGELANLKAERDQLKADLEKSDGVVWTLSVENDRLKAEVAGVKSLLLDNLEASKKTYIEREGLLQENARLKAEVERLTKAGDAMHCFLIGYIVENRLSSAHLNKLDDDWSNAAKGVQS
jgi:predicted  nucleic acid-binding Zn-ribbon protein